VRDSHSPASRSIGAGKGYVYPHSTGGWADQRYLPEELSDAHFFEPIAGTEAELARDLEEKKKQEPPTG
jgi:putative ATPase